MTRGLPPYWVGVWTDKRLKGSQAAFQAVCLSLTRPLTLDATPLSFFLIETRRRRYMSVIRETVRMRLESLDSWREEVEPPDSLGIPEVYMASEFRRLMPMKDEVSHKSLGNSPECFRAEPLYGDPRAHRRGLNRESCGTRSRPGQRSETSTRQYCNPMRLGTACLRRY